MSPPPPQHRLLRMRISTQATSTRFERRPRASGSATRGTQKWPLRRARVRLFAFKESPQSRGRLQVCARDRNGRGRLLRGGGERERDIPGLRRLQQHQDHQYRDGGGESRYVSNPAVCSSQWVNAVLRRCLQ